MFLILIPRIATNLEFHLLDLNIDSKVRNIINKLLGSVFREHVFVADFCNLPLEDFKHLAYNQATTFRKLFFNVLKNEFSIEELDQVFINIFREAIELLYRIDPNSQGIENTLGQARREFRGNTWINDYDTYRHVSETILLNLEKMTNSQIPALIFYFAKALELVVNELVEMRSKGIINLIFVDSQFIEMKRGEEYSGIVATLSLDQASRTASLQFHTNSNVLDRRSAQRLAHSVTKFGFERADKSRVGMNFILEVHEPEFA